MFTVAYFDNFIGHAKSPAKEHRFLVLFSSKSCSVDSYCRYNILVSKFSKKIHPSNVALYKPKGMTNDHHNV